MREPGTTRLTLGLCLVCLASLTLCSTATAQTVKLPKEVQGDPGTIVIVKAETDCETLRWLSLDDGLSLIPPELLKSSKTAVVMAGKAGRYRLLAYGALKGEASEPAVCSVLIGPVPPGPVPPGPIPPVPPDPPTPVPGTVTHVLVVYETADVSKLPAAQQQVLYSKVVRDLLDKVTPVGPDGKTHQWRIYDKDVDASAEDKVWQELLKKPRQSVPWVIFAGEKGTAYEGPLPANVAEMQALIQKFAPTAPRYEQYRKAG